MKVRTGVIIILILLFIAAGPAASGDFVHSTWNDVIVFLQHLR